MKKLIFVTYILLSHICVNAQYKYVELGDGKKAQGIAVVDSAGTQININGRSDTAKVSIKGPIDEMTGAVETITYPHHEIHEGNSYSVIYGGTISNNDSINFVITVDSSYQAHFIYGAASGGNAAISLYEDVTIVGGGTPMTVRNRNRDIGDGGGGATVLRDPVAELGSVILDGLLLPGGTGGNSVGASGSARDEWILAPGKIYSLHIQNISGVAKAMSLRIEWYIKPAQ